MPRRRVAHLPGPPSTTVEGWWLAAVVLAGILLRLWLLTSHAGLTMDSPLYVRMADSLAAGRRAIEPAHHGYSTLIAGVSSIVPGREWPGRIVSLLCGVLLIPVVHALAATVAGPRWALLAAALVALHPLLAVYSGAIMTESLFVLIVAVGLLMVATHRYTSGGLWFGLGYVVRPEALVIAPAAALLGRGGIRGTLAVLIGFLAVAVPYAGYLRLERGAWTLTPKEALVRPAFETAEDAEWRVGAPAAPGGVPQRLVDRVRWAAPSMGATYLANLRRHAARLIEIWPWPLMVLSLCGLAVAPGPPLAPLLMLAVLPLLAIPFDARFLLPALPSLAAYAAAAAAWIMRRWPRVTALAPAAATVAAAGLALCWIGPPGLKARAFDDGPMAEMRAAGEWLREHGRAGAIVMDRKAYVPFFAGMRHVQLPNDSLGTILEHARTTGVDYLVVEEYVVAAFRPQLAPLLTDPQFRERERRLRVLHVVRSEPMTGVAVFEVVRNRPAGR